MAVAYAGVLEMRGRLAVRLAVTVALALALAPIATAGAQSSYRVVEIGPVPGFDISRGDDINASGQVVGTLQGAPYLRQWSAFVWDTSSGLRALGDVAGEGTFGRGINDDAVVTGAAESGHVYAGQTAFRWTAEGGFESLGAGFPNDINNAGEVIGYTAGPGWVRWDASGQTQPFGSLPSIYGSPHAIKNNGQIVGYAPGAGPAQIWDPQTGLGQLPAFPGGYGALAYDINDLNDLGYATGAADVPYTTKRSTACGVRATSCAVILRDARPAAIGPNFSYGYGINNDDDVVGQFIGGS